MEGRIAREKLYGAKPINEAPREQTRIKLHGSNHNHRVEARPIVEPGRHQLTSTSVSYPEESSEGLNDDEILGSKSRPRTAAVADT